MRILTAASRWAGQRIPERDRIPAWLRPGNWSRPLAGLGHWCRRRTRVLVSTLLSLTCMITIAALAYTAKGFPVSQVSLHDGGVWVTSRSEGAIGRFNRPIEQLDSRLVPSKQNQPDLDLLQDADTVFVHDRGASELRRVDVAVVEASPDTAVLPAGALVALGGGTIAVLDPASGKVWTKSSESVLTLDTTLDPPTVEAGKDAALAVGLDGLVHIVSPDQHRLVTVTGAGTATPRLSRHRLSADLSVPVRITAVGAGPVIVDERGKVVLPSGRTVSLPVAPAGSGAGSTTFVPQQPGPKAETALIATETGVLAVRLTDGAVADLLGDGGGAPVAPVRLGRCVYAAWSARPTYVRRCAGQASGPTHQLDGVAPGSALTFRVNRDAIVLNELATGAIFVYERGGTNLGDWNAVRPVARPDDDDANRNIQQEPSDRNRPPIARPDQLAARPGRSAVLNVLDNDGDPDGDVLVVTGASPLEPAEAGRIAIIHSGQALQFTANPGWNQTARLRYLIDDGRGGTSQADVTITARDDQQNTAPRLLRETTATVGQGGSVTVDVLRDWRDDDGDPLVLASATTPAPDTARFVPSGEMTFTDGGTGAARKAVDIAVSDGRATSVPAKVTIDVYPRERDAPPVANDDLVRVVAGTDITVRPLANDTDPNSSVPGHESQIRLTRVSPAPAGSSVIPDYVTGTIAFRATRPQTYYLEYEITNNRLNAKARIRIDVRPAARSTTPTAVADRAALRGMVPADVDLLANDVDDDGDVLVVEAVTVPENAGIAVSLRDHRWLRIEPTQLGSGTIALRYVVSDGSNRDEGTVEVTRLPTADNDQPPTAREDAVTVRAGAVATVDVLANDVDPEGSPLDLAGTVVGDDDARGRWLVSGRVVRFQAPTTPGTVNATYTVRDASGLTANARVVATVTAADPEHNQPPRPAPVEARTFTGSTLRIPIPLAGADPDGDSVVLIGAARAPRLGRVIAVGPDYLDYEAYPAGAGTDEFSYQLRDGLGARGTGTVRVGVTARPSRNAAPFAVDDRYTVAPGATIRVPVLANDGDVDGDALRLEPLEPVNPAGLNGAKLADDRVVVTAGRHDGDTVTIQYGISDGRGQRATGSLTVVARTGANLPPTARDDVVTVIPPGQDTVVVDVLANDDDLDGARGDLRLQALGDGSAAPVTVTDDRKLRIAVAPVAREVAYQITDERGASAVAFVKVAAGGDQLPHRRPGAPALTVATGQTLVIDIAAQIVDPEGAEVHVTAAAGVTTSPTAGLTVTDGGVTASRLTIQSATGFYGPAAVAVEVTDRAQDAPERTVVVLLPVTVLPADNEKLDLACPAAQPRVGAPAVQVDLADCVRGVVEDDRSGLRFSGLAGAPTGVQAKLDRAILSITAGARAEPERASTLTVTVTDPKGRTATGTIEVLVSPAGLPVAATDIVDGVRAGSQIRVDVTANDTNPFPRTPLTVVDVRSESPAATATIDGDQRHVSVQIDGDFHGTAALTYQVQDSTGRRERLATGRIEVNVVGLPEAPGKPVVRNVGNASAVLTWAQPADNGAPITGYEVSGGGFTQRCAVTVCSLTGLTNGQRYTFTVTAENAVGRGQPSPASDEARPDVQPDQPSPPSTAFGDSAVTVTWTAPRSQGSPVARYEVEVSPAVGGVRQTTATSLIWTGLTNGTGYTFRVRAYNESDQASEWSGYSAPEVPAKAPEPPAAPTSVGVADGVGQQMVVTWSAPLDNGAAITAYRLTVLRAGTVDRTLTIDGDTTQTTVSVVNGVSYTYRLTAVNKAGESVAGAISAGAVAHGRPAKVTALTVSDNSGGTGYDRRLRYDLTPPDNNGMAISRYELNYTGGSAPNLTSSSSGGFITGLSNGVGYRVKVRACNDMCGEWSNPSGTATPYGPVGTPGASASRSGSRQVRLSWSPPGTNGRPIARLEIRVDGGGWENVGAGSGSRTVGNGPNQTHSVQVRAFDTAGQGGPTRGASATTAPPSVLVSNSHVSAKGQPGCSADACAYIQVDLRNFGSGESVTCTFDSSLGAGGFVTFTTTVDGAGNGGGRTKNYLGHAGGWASATCNGVTGKSDAW
ncbi:MAG: cadherin-like domain-containing protein [Dactylosporangium sp.]|nr:cadherin-like domain-containing protein [Dactylosporangium sp.]NNJ61237.1 cadherin-like domain-containing protein [Dactylosporangium sp.]